MPGSRHEEVERKYSAAPGTQLPDLTGRGDVAEVRARPPEDLEAVYFDTAGLDLLRHHVTLRRRVGGADEGWHLKEPAGEDTRAETRLPLGRAVHTVPKPLREAVASLTGEHPLLPVARVSTRRVEHELDGPGGTVLAVLCDDDVHAERLLAPRLKQHWREWEVELADAPHGLLDLVESELLGAGARYAEVSSKVARALVAESPHRGPAPRPNDLRASRSSTWEVLAAYLGEHLPVLEAQGAGLHGETVHQLRIAARRLRSALSTYGPLFAPGAVDDLREELRWLGQALGGARDAEVLGGDLDDLLAQEPDRPYTASLRQHVQRDLDASQRLGRQEAVETLASERFRMLLRMLGAAAESPDLTSAASAPARMVLPHLLARDARRVRRAARAARRKPPGTAHDQALHEVRKKAKRLRYAAESASPVLGKRARRLATRAEALQESLGAHQDTVACRAWLEGLAGRSTGDPAVAFGAGRLHARAEQRARSAEEDYEQAWQRLPHQHVGRWVRGRSS